MDSVCVSSKAVASGSNIEGRSDKRIWGVTITRVDNARIANGKIMCAIELGVKGLVVKNLVLRGLVVKGLDI